MTELISLFPSEILYGPNRSTSSSKILAYELTSGVVQDLYEKNWVTHKYNYGLDSLGNNTYTGESVLSSGASYLITDTGYVDVTGSRYRDTSSQIYIVGVSGSANLYACPQSGFSSFAGVTTGQECERYIRSDAPCVVFVEIGTAKQSFITEEAAIVAESFPSWTDIYNSSGSVGQNFINVFAKDLEEIKIKYFNFVQDHIVTYAQTGLMYEAWETLLYNEIPLIDVIGDGVVLGRAEDEIEFIQAPGEHIYLSYGNKIYTAKEYTNFSINGFVHPQSKVYIGNTFDHFAAQFNLYRLPDEDNNSLLARILDVYVNPPGADEDSLHKAIERESGASVNNIYELEDNEVPWNPYPDNPIQTEDILISLANLDAEDWPLLSDSFIARNVEYHPLTGKKTVDKIVRGTSSGVHTISPVSGAMSGSYIFNFLAKSDGSYGSVVTFLGGISKVPGTFNNITNAPSQSSGFYLSQEDIGNGWWSNTLKGDFSGATYLNLYIGPGGANLGSGHAGTAQTGSTYSITLSTGASSTGSIYNNAVLYITSGVGSGQSRTVTGYDGTTKIASLNSAWNTVPNNTSYYVVGFGMFLTDAKLYKTSDMTTTGYAEIPTQEHIELANWVSKNSKTSWDYANADQVLWNNEDILESYGEVPYLLDQSPTSIDSGIGDGEDLLISILPEPEDVTYRVGTFVKGVESTGVSYYPPVLVNGDIYTTGNITTWTNSGDYAITIEGTHPSGTFVRSFSGSIANDTYVQENRNQAIIPLRLRPDTSEIFEWYKKDATGAASGLAWDDFTSYALFKGYCSSGTYSLTGYSSKISFSPSSVVTTLTVSASGHPEALYIDSTGSTSGVSIWESPEYPFDIRCNTTYPATGAVSGSISCPLIIEQPSGLSSVVTYMRINSVAPPSATYTIKFIPTGAVPTSMSGFPGTGTTIGLSSTYTATMTEYVDYESSEAFVTGTVSEINPYDIITLSSGSYSLPTGFLIESGFYGYNSTGEVSVRLMDYEFNPTGTTMIVSRRGSTHPSWSVGVHAGSYYINQDNWFVHTDMVTETVPSSSTSFQLANYMGFGYPLTITSGNASTNFREIRFIDSNNALSHQIEETFVGNGSRYYSTIYSDIYNVSGKVESDPNYHAISSTTGNVVDFYSIGIASGIDMQGYPEDINSWSKSGTYVISNIYPNPIDGQMNADKVIEDTTTGSHYVVRNVTKPTATGNYTWCFYAKAGERSEVAIYFRGSDAADFLRARFNLTGGTIPYSSVGGTWTNSYTDIRNAGNGWWLCIASATVDASSTLMPILCTSNGIVTGANNSFTGTLGHGVYVWGSMVTSGDAPYTYPILSTGSSYTIKYNVNKSYYIDYDNNVSGSYYPKLYFDKAYSNLGVKYTPKSSVENLIDSSLPLSPMYTHNREGFLMLNSITPTATNIEFLTYPNVLYKGETKRLWFKITDVNDNRIYNERVNFTASSGTLSAVSGSTTRDGLVTVDITVPSVFSATGITVTGKTTTGPSGTLTYTVEAQETIPTGVIKILTTSYDASDTSYPIHTTTGIVYNSSYAAVSSPVVGFRVILPDNSVSTGNVTGDSNGIFTKSYTPTMVGKHVINFTYSNAKNSTGFMII